MENKDFIITKVSWLTKKEGLNINIEKVIKVHKSLALFLQQNKLTSRVILKENQQINDDFCIKSSDLTNEGLMVLRKGFEKWLDAVDKNQDPSNVKILEKTLKKIREKN